MLFRSRTMTKEDLLKGFQIIMKQNSKDLEKAADLIWDLWMNHPSYAIVAGKIVNKDTGVELGN